MDLAKVLFNLKLMPNKIIHSQQRCVSNTLDCKLFGDQFGSFGEFLIFLTVELIIVAGQSRDPKIVEANIGASVPQYTFIRVDMTKQFAHHCRSHTLNI